MQEDRNYRIAFSPNPIAATILAIAFIICAVVVGGSVVRAKTDSEIKVIGSARKQIRSDMAVWTASVTRQGESASEIYAQIQADKEKVKAYLLKEGIAEAEIVPLSISSKTLYPPAKNEYGEYEYSSRGGDVYRKPVGYQLTQEIQVRSGNVDLVARISRESTQLISEGVPLESYNPMYLYTQMSDLKEEMQAEAAKDARAKAQQIARSSGCRVGKLKYARMNVPSITPIYSNEENDYGMDDTSSIEKKITAIVVAGYAVK